MPSKATYLRDIADHPSTTAGQAAERLRVNETAAIEAYRRACREGLVECDKGQPSRYRLTETAAQKLPMLEAQDAPAGNGANNSPREDSQPAVLQRLTAIEEALSGIDEMQEMIVSLTGDVADLFRVVDERLGLDTGEEEDENGASESAAADGPNSKLLELVSLRSEMGWLDKHSSRGQKVKDLEAELGPDISTDVEHLVELQRNRTKKLRGWSSSTDEPVKEIESEIASLREKLGLPAETEAEESAEEAAETEE